MNLTERSINHFYEKTHSTDVVTYCVEQDCFEQSCVEQGLGEGNAGALNHEKVSHEYLAKKIAALLSCNYAGEYDAAHDYAHSSLYFIPNDTLLLAQAHALGIRDTTHFFGGCVPFPSTATKSITHNLISSQADAPAGWSSNFSKSVEDVTLLGYSAFSKSDARIAVERLLRHGDVRIKAPRQWGGNGQTVVTSCDAADSALAAIDDEECRLYGIVVEINLSDVTTRSIGSVCIGGTQISYCGNQLLTFDTRGRVVYGGSTLRAVRGDLAALLQLQWSMEEDQAIAQAIVYDRAAHASFAGFFASRRNYDVGQGFDHDNKMCSGVFEQSWRIGGASPAEIAAVEAFVGDSRLVSVRTSCREVHALCRVPANATMYFRGCDATVGEMTKFVSVDTCEY